MIVFKFLKFLFAETETCSEVKVQQLPNVSIHVEEIKGNLCYRSQQRLITEPPLPVVHDRTPLKGDLLWASLVLVNALTILDLVLSRRTKPWRFFLRVLYRVSRSNFKWIAACFFCHVGYQCGGSGLIDGLLEAAFQHRPALQMQETWLTLQSYPILSTLTFALYNLMAGWILHRLMPRNNIQRSSTATSSDGQNGSVTGNTRSSRSFQSRWALLVECLFRPVSFATAHNLTDFDFELDDSMELLIERLALPNLWLTPVVPTDYLKYLPVWQFNGWTGEQCDRSGGNRLEDEAFAVQPLNTDITLPLPSSSSTSTSSLPWPCNADQPPACMIPSSECAICLDKYRCSVQVCGLPCGHHFHYGCISIWIQRDNHHCPICRWPAYRNKCPSSI